MHMAIAAPCNCNESANTPMCLGAYEAGISATKPVSIFRASCLTTNPRLRGMSMNRSSPIPVQTLTTPKTKIKQMIIYRPLRRRPCLKQLLPSTRQYDKSSQPHPDRVSVPWHFHHMPAILPYKSATVLRSTLEMPTVLTTTTFLEVLRSEINGGRYSDCSPNEARSGEQYGTLYGEFQVLILVSIYGDPRLAIRWSDLAVSRDVDFV